MKTSVTFWYSMVQALKRTCWLIVWEETLALQQARCIRTGLWPTFCRTDANAIWEATDPLEGNTAIKRSCPEKSHVFKQSAYASNTVCPKHTFVLANCAYARKCLKPGPGQVSTGRNLLKWSIWRCSTTRLCFWGISVPGFGHAFTGKPNGAQLDHTPMRRRLTSHIWTPVCQTHHLATWLC